MRLGPAARARARPRRPRSAPARHRRDRSPADMRAAGCRAFASRRVVGRHPPGRPMSRWHLPTRSARSRHRDVPRSRVERPARKTRASRPRIRRIPRYIANSGASLGSACTDARNRLLSHSACTTSATGGACGQDATSTTASAASSAKAPSNVEHCARAACSHAVRSAHDQSMAASSVACRCDAPRIPPSHLKRSRIRNASSPGENTLTRAAASSMASGRPSSRRTTSATAARLASSSTNAGRCARALRRIDRSRLRRARAARSQGPARRAAAGARGS